MSVARYIKAGVDSTDHLAFFCGECNAMLKVTKVKTHKVTVRTEPLTFGQCTWIHLVCPMHGEVGWRKFYWKPDEGARNNYALTADTQVPSVSLRAQNA